MDRNQSSTLKLIRQHCFPNPLYSSVITLSHNPPFFSSQHLFKTQGMTVSQRRALEGGKGERCSGWWDWRVTDPLEDEALMSHRDPVSSTHWSRWMMTGFVKGLCVCVCDDLLLICCLCAHMWDTSPRTLSQGTWSHRCMNSFQFASAFSTRSAHLLMVLSQLKPDIVAPFPCA